MADQRHTFGRDRRIRKRAEFDAVFEAKRRASCHELLVCVLPAGRMRLGISMSRKVGTAARRNRIKRLVREAFRLSHEQWSGPMDVVVVPRPHEPMSLARYVAMLKELVGKAGSRR